MKIPSHVAAELEEVCGRDWSNTSASYNKGYLDYKYGIALTDDRLSDPDYVKGYKDAYADGARPWNAPARDDS
jgi:hypothetical protein